MRILKKKTATPKQMTEELAMIPAQKPPEIPTAAPNQPRVQPELQQVLFHRTFLNAKSVLIAGTFNNWRPSAAEVKNCGRGSWCVDLMLKPGKYEYRFVVDHRWTDDPVTHNQIPNPFGGHNTVLTVTNRTRKSETVKIPVLPVPN